MLLHRRCAAGSTRIWHCIAIVYLSVFLANCAALQTGACRKGEIKAISDLLYFGTEKPEGNVTSSEWGAFLEEVVTVRFPDGFTWWDGIGQWQGPDGRITQEVSFMLQIVHPDRPDQNDAIREIILAYKKKFTQKAVLQLRTPVCASFWETDDAG